MHQLAVDLVAGSRSEELHRNGNSSSPTATVPEEMRCQYSSKRCEFERTHKKSGGLHKFCAMHREKANRNQMRLDQRRRVLKQQQKDLQRQQQALNVEALQAQQLPRFSPAAMAAGQNYGHMNRNQWRPMGTRRSVMNVKPLSPPNMKLKMPIQWEQQTTPNLPLFDQHDLDILEALLFSSDEEQCDATLVTHFNTPCAPAFVSTAPLFRF